MRSFDNSPNTSPRMPRGESEIAMLSKKPLGGWSCASCEKDLTNIYKR